MKMNKITTQTTLNEKKRTFLRSCKRCNNLFYSHSKHSKFCQKCYQGSNYVKLFGKLNEEVNND